MKPEPSENIVPFGKYKDQPIESLLSDTGYLEWVLNQPTLVELIKRKWPDFYDTITLGSVPQDSPAHNKLQAHFLDRGVQIALIKLVTSNDPLARYATWRDRHNCSSQKAFDDLVVVIKEALSKPGNDCWISSPILTGTFTRDELKIRLTEGPSKLPEQLPITILFESNGFDICLEPNHLRSLEPRILIELKPLMGDDYPSVLRQIRRQMLFNKDHCCLPCLVIEIFHSSVCTLEQVRGIFAPIKIITMAEINALLE